jgi:hypothetical protein
MMNLEGPAHTFNYMLLGYAVILGCVAFLVISLAARCRALKRELHVLQEREKRGKN